MARKPVPHSGTTYPGWVAQPINASAHGLVVTAGPSLQGKHSTAQLVALAHPKPAVHWQAGNGATLCNISTQVPPQGHRTYGLNFVLVTAMPAPRKGVAFSPCGRCQGVGMAAAMAIWAANNG